MPSYSPEILTTLKDIARVFGVSKNKVRQWEKDGAPIVREGDGDRARYRTEEAALWEWLLSKKSGQNISEETKNQEVSLERPFSFSAGAESACYPSAQGGLIPAERLRENPAQNALGRVLKDVSLDSYEIVKRL